MLYCTFQFISVQKCLNCSSSCIILLVQLLYCFADVAAVVLFAGAAVVLFCWCSCCFVLLVLLLYFAGVAAVILFCWYCSSCVVCWCSTCVVCWCSSCVVCWCSSC